MNPFTSIVLVVAVVAALILLREAFKKQFLDTKDRVATDTGKSAEFQTSGEVFTQDKGGRK